MARRLDDDFEDETVERPEPKPKAEKKANGQGDAPEIIPARATRGGAFIAAYEAIYYSIEGILPSGMLYGTTARRSGGKTAFFIMTACAVIRGLKEVMGCDVDAGRVAYIIKENPQDFRMKLAVNFEFHGISREAADERLLVLDWRIDGPEQIAERLKRDAGEYGDFKLICYDTFQAGFAGAGGVQFNDNAEVLKFVLRLRELTEIPGNPPGLVAFHPVKSVTEDNLEPYGGGAIINELDGNLTLWGPLNQLKLHHNKVRGYEFDPKYFEIKMQTCPDIVDQKGVLIRLPVCAPLSEKDMEARKEASAETQTMLLKAIFYNPKGSQRDWMDAAGLKSTGSIGYALAKLAKDKLAEKSLGKWAVTPKGKRMLKESGEIL